MDKEKAKRHLEVAREMLGLCRGEYSLYKKVGFDNASETIINLIADMNKTKTLIAKYERIAM